MTVSVPLLPAMVSIPAGVFNGSAIGSFQLGRTAVTNAEYAAHVDRYSSRPFVLLHTDPETHSTSVLCRVKAPEEVIGYLEGHLPEHWDGRYPFMFSVFTLFQLRKDMSPEGFDRPNQPVVKVSWFHAFEYCVSNGLFLPSDDQWGYAARGPEGHGYGTRSGKLTREEAHYDSDATVDVGSYPPNGFGLQDMTGNVWEWTARDPNQQYPYGLRGGSWLSGYPEDLRVASRCDCDPDDRLSGFGFRVGASVLQGSK